MVSSSKLSRIPRSSAPIMLEAVELKLPLLKFLEAGLIPASLMLEAVEMKAPLLKLLEVEAGEMAGLLLD